MAILPRIYRKGTTLLEYWKLQYQWKLWHQQLLWSISLLWFLIFNRASSADKDCKEHFVCEGRDMLHFNQSLIIDWLSIFLAIIKNELLSFIESTLWTNDNHKMLIYVSHIKNCIYNTRQHNFFSLLQRQFCC